jgi:superfamily I DNA/RNA helicase
MTNGQTPKVAIAADFLGAFSRIPRQQQNKVMEFIDKFREDPTSPGINYERIQSARDAKLRSVRVDLAYRAIVLKPAAGNVYVLLWVDHHDAAYDWARKRVCNIHPETGSLQVIDAEVATAQPEAPPVRATPGLFDGFRDRELVSLGVPEDLLPRVRSIATEEDLDAVSEILPGEAFDSLFLLAAGYTLEEVYRELDRSATKGVVNTEDFSAALENPESQRRFFVVDDEMELKAILAAPLEKWRVFLHPSQRKLVARDWNGPVRVLGGAGTGKTVVAMHRAKWLVENRCLGERDRVLFTTFTRNLAADIGANLRKICTDNQLAKIEVVNLDKWVSDFLRKRGYGFDIDYGNRTQALWEKALALMPTELNLTPEFYREEWEEVVQAQGVATFAEYATASRVGRGVRVNRRERKLIWPVFEEYRLLLDEHGLREPDDAMRDAYRLLEQEDTDRAYQSIVVDEAQDMGPQAFRLLRQLIPGGDQPNDLFVVGDAHQRIYRHKVVLGRCGINIRGRSRKLRVNYRTTEENRRWAVALLEGTRFDDLDGGEDDQKGYKSLLHGTTPEVHRFDNAQHEHGFIVEHLAALRRDGVDFSTVCVVARTHALVDQLQRVLAAAHVEHHMVHRNQAEDRRVPGARLATMHRVKGLEFERVIIAGVNRGVVPLDAALSKSEDLVLRRETEARERALLYVSATRARNTLVVTCSGEPSPFLSPLA